VPRSAAITVQNNFSKGLITEATGLNFPENSCTETYNCIFRQTGEVERRLGFDLEGLFETQTVVSEGKVISQFLWNAAGGEGGVNFVVVQIGALLYFYRVGLKSPLSGGIHATTINLGDFDLATSPDPGLVECQFASGNGLLFVTHPYCESFYVTYSTSANTLTATQIDLTIRDFEGEVQDTNAVNTRPASLVVTHQYNLLNQGWIGTGGAAALSLWQNFSLTTNGTSTSGTKTLTGLAAADTAKIAAGMAVSGTSIAASTRVETMLPPPAGSSSVTSLRLDTNATGSTTSAHTYTMGNVPSNADVWWLFKDSTGQFALHTIDDINRGTSPAPKGHFILNLYDQNRNTASGLSTLTNYSTGYKRVSTCAFYAGRVFYAGLGVDTYNSSIFFTQIAERPKQYGQCHQVNDPTAEDLFDLLPSDGGVIKILEADNIVKMVPVFGHLVVFARNGIWTISGSSGVGFTATDYIVRKISSIRNFSHSSFVDVQGIPIWWTNDGICTLKIGETDQVPQVVIISDQNIKTFYDSIPDRAKLRAKGAYNSITHIAQWVYRSADLTDAPGLEQEYRYDRILNLNTLTGAFYPWSVNTSDNVDLHGVVTVEGSGSNIIQYNVLANADTVIANADNVVIFAPESTETPLLFKYLVSYTQSGNTKFTFADVEDADYVDWASDPVSPNIDYESYFITGYQVRGEAQRKWQSNQIYIYSRNDSNVAYTIQGRWNYATSGSTGRWSSSQTRTIPSGNYAYVYRKLKVRGHGVALQYKLSSVSGEPFFIVGWSVTETANQKA